MGVLDGKAVVVTGAGRGLGRAYALHAASCGAAVVVNDVDGEPADEVVSLVRDAGGRAVASVGSVVDPDYAEAVVRLCRKEFGAIDGLVNNAGLRHQAPIWAEDPARVRALIETNVLGTMHCGAAAAAAMREQGGGSIVNAGSFAMVGQPTASAYSASKGAVASMTVAWAVELEEHGVRVNAVCPVAWTRMAAADTRTPPSPDQTPDRIAPIVTYLLSDRAAGVTGQLIRFTTAKLHVVHQIGVREPVIPNDGLDVDELAELFDTRLADALEPFPAKRSIR